MLDIVDNEIVEIAYTNPTWRTLIVTIGVRRGLVTSRIIALVFCCQILP